MTVSAYIYSHYCEERKARRRSSTNNRFYFSKSLRTHTHSTWRWRLRPDKEHEADLTLNTKLNEGQTGAGNQLIIKLIRPGRNWVTEHMGSKNTTKTVQGRDIYIYIYTYYNVMIPKFILKLYFSYYVICHQLSFVHNIITNYLCIYIYIYNDMVTFNI